jgi:hypothetical protein
VWLTWKSATLADSEVRLTQVMEVCVMESAAVCQQGLPSQPPSQGVRELAAARTPGGIAFKLVSRASSFLVRLGLMAVTVCHGLLRVSDRAGRASLLQAQGGVGGHGTR